MSNVKAVNPRNARTPREGEQLYVLAQGAPKHYVDGYGLVGAGAIVSLAPGVTPGRWYVEVSPDDASKAQASETDAQRLAVMAAAKIQADGTSGDVERKRESDRILQQKLGEEAKQAAQREADAIRRVAEADAKIQQASDGQEAARRRAQELQDKLDKALAELAAAQSQLEKAAASAPAAGDKAQGEAKSSDKPK